MAKKSNDLVLLDKYNLPSEKRIHELSSKSESVISLAKEIKVTSSAKAEEADNIRLGLKSAIKKIESLFEDSLDEVKKAKQQIEKARKTIVTRTDELTEPFKDALSLVNRKLIDFNRAEEERLEKLEQAKEAAASKKKSSTPVEMPKIKTEENRSASISATYVDNWKGRVIDFAKLPDEYKIVDQVKLNNTARELKDGFVIPGAEAYNDKYLK